MHFHASHAVHLHPTVVAVLPDRDDYDALCLALETMSLDCDVVLFQDACAGMRHLRQCTRTSLTANRRWPELIVLDAELPELKVPAWLAKSSAFLENIRIFTPVLVLALESVKTLSRDWPRQPDEVVIKCRNGREFIRVFSQALKYWLRRSEIERLGNRPEITLSKSTRHTA